MTDAPNLAERLSNLARKSEELREAAAAETLAHLTAASAAQRQQHRSR